MSTFEEKLKRAFHENNPNWYSITVDSGNVQDRAAAGDRIQGLIPDGSRVKIYQSGEVSSDAFRIIVYTDSGEFVTAIANAGYFSVERIEKPEKTKEISLVLES